MVGMALPARSSSAWSWQDAETAATAVTIAISPTSATVLLGTSFQFVATPTGSTNAVQWSVNGVANGNATVGTISSTGLYTAPGTRPVAASAVAVPIIFAVANASRSEFRLHGLRH